MINKFCFCLIIVAAVALSVFTQQPKNKPDPEIAKMVKEISAKNIEATIRKLVSFGTRNTLSEQDNPVRGVGAARDWIYSEFQKISADCGGCLQVEKQTFLQPKANRVPEPTNLTNVFALLKGTTDPDRVYVVSGHYDSMCTSPTDAKCDAPGANDDASGHGRLDRTRPRNVKAQIRRDHHLYDRPGRGAGPSRRDIFRASRPSRKR